MSSHRADDGPQIIDFIIVGVMMLMTVNALGELAVMWVLSQNSLKGGLWLLHLQIAGPDELAAA
jgi:hypothetical protein